MWCFNRKEMCALVVSAMQVFRLGFGWNVNSPHLSSIYEWISQVEAEECKESFHQSSHHHVNKAKKVATYNITNIKGHSEWKGPLGVLFVLVFFGCKAVDGKTQSFLSYIFKKTSVLMVEYMKLYEYVMHSSLLLHQPGVNGKDNIIYNFTCCNHLLQHVSLIVTVEFSDGVETVR